MRFWPRQKHFYWNWIVKRTTTKANLKTEQMMPFLNNKNRPKKRFSGDLINAMETNAVLKFKCNQNHHIKLNKMYFDEMIMKSENRWVIFFLSELPSFPFSIVSMWNILKAEPCCCCYCECNPIHQNHINFY